MYFRRFAIKVLVEPELINAVCFGDLQERVVMKNAMK